MARAVLIPVISMASSTTISPTSFKTATFVFESVVEVSSVWRSVKLIIKLLVTFVLEIVSATFVATTPVVAEWFASSRWQLESLPFFDGETIIKALFTAIAHEMVFVCLLVYISERFHWALKFLCFVKLNYYGSFLALVLVVNY